MLVIKTIFIFCLIFFSGCKQHPSYWSENELKILSSFQLSQLALNDSESSNRFSNNKDAALFGKQLFFDKRLSLDGSISCASCHQPEKAFTDGLDKAQGIHKTGRNTQSILGVAHYHWFYWDGRKDSLWSQALVPFEAADEMASSRVQVLRIVGSDPNYRKQYEKLFGTFPQIIFSSEINEQAGPWGDITTRDNWFRIPVPTQKVINQAYANIGKSIAAYERKIPLPETRFDNFLTILFREGEREANSILNQNELQGIKLFISQEKTHCLRCHNGPLLTNSEFHNIGTGNFDGPTLDFGRYLGIQAAIQDEFNCLGEYSDAKPETCTALRFLPKQVHGDMQGAFKTPSLRYLGKTAPYFHDGRFDNLEEVLEHYVSVEKNQTELPELVLSQQELQQLIAFLELLND